MNSIDSVYAREYCRVVALTTVSSLLIVVIDAHRKNASGAHRLAAGYGSTMHEAGIALQVIDACAIHLRKHGASQATCVGLRIGALASVDPDALRFCFDSLKKGTPLDSAALRIEWRSRFGCTCEHTPVVLDAQPGVCPSCGATESLADACALDIRYLEFDDGTDDEHERAD